MLSQQYHPLVSANQQLSRRRVSTDLRRELKSNQTLFFQKTEWTIPTVSGQNCRRSLRACRLWILEMTLAFRLISSFQWKGEANYVLFSFKGIFDLIKN